jgi:IMP dehydrogenase
VLYVKKWEMSFHIMAGNVATLQGVNDLADWGADSVRCNIGGGSICSTRIQTGHGMPGLETIFECAKTDRDVAIIADGGIKELWRHGQSS